MGKKATHKPEAPSLDPREILSQLDDAVVQSLQLGPDGMAELQDRVKRMKVGEEDGSTASTALPGWDEQQRAGSVSSAPSADAAIAPTLTLTDEEVTMARKDSTLVHCPSFEDSSKEALVSQAISPPSASAASAQMKRADTLDASLDVMSMQPGVPPIAKHAAEAAMIRRSGPGVVSLGDVNCHGKRPSEMLPSLSEADQKKYKQYWQQWRPGRAEEAASCSSWTGSMSQQWLARRESPVPAHGEQAPGDVGNLFAAVQAVAMDETGHAASKQPIPAQSSTPHAAPPPCRVAASPTMPEVTARTLAARDGGITFEGVIAPTPHTMFFNPLQPQEPAPPVPTQQQSPAALAPVGASMANATPSEPTQKTAANLAPVGASIAAAALSPPTQQQTPGTLAPAAAAPSAHTQQQTPGTLAPVGASMAAAPDPAQQATLAPAAAAPAARTQQQTPGTLAPVGAAPAQQLSPATLLASPDPAQQQTSAPFGAPMASPAALAPVGGSLGPVALAAPTQATGPAAVTPVEPPKPMEGHAQTLAALEAAAPADTAAVYHGKGASKGMPQTPAAALPTTASLDSKAIEAQVQAAQPEASVPSIAAGESPTTFAPLARPKHMEAQAQTLAASPAFPPASQAAHTAASHATFASQAGNVTQSTPVALESPATLPPPGEPKPLRAAAFLPASEATSTPPQLASPGSTLALGRDKPMEAQALTLMAAQSSVSQAANLARSIAVTAHPAPGQEGVPGPAGAPTVAHNQACGEASVPPPPSLVEVAGTTLTTKAVAMVAPLSPANVAPVAGVTKTQAQTFQTAASPANLAQTTVQPPVAMPNAAMLAAPQSPGAEAQTLTPNPHTMSFKLPQLQEPAPSVLGQQQTPATLAPVGAPAAPSAPTQHQTLATSEFTQQQSPATLASVGASMAAQPAALAPTSHTAPAVAAIPVHNSATAPALEGKTAERPAAAALPGQGSAQSGPDQVFLAALQTIVQKGMDGGAQEALVILDSVLKMRSGNGNVLSAATAMGSAPLAHADGAMPGSEATAAPNSLAPATPSLPPALPPNGPGLQALPESVVAEDAGQLARKLWANSVTHPKEWISFKRFSEKNSETCATVCQAFAKGGDARLLMFQKWLLAEGDGHALEACLKFKRIQEERSQDAGTYVKWDKVLSHFEQDLAKATDFVQRRRQMLKGTSRNRNDNQETFLWFDDETRTWTTTNIEEVCMEVGADPATAATLMQKMTSNSGALPGPPAPLPLCDGDAGDQSAGPPPLPNQHDDSKKPDPPQKKEKKPKQPKPPGSQLELMVSDEGDIAEFARRWVQAASEAAGACAKVQADLEALESQGELINLLAASSQGISDSRKKLTSLGPNPTVEGVRGVLQVASQFVESYKKHIKVAQGLMQQAKRDAAPKKAPKKAK